MEEISQDEEMSDGDEDVDPENPSTQEQLAAVGKKIQMPRHELASFFENRSFYERGRIFFGWKKLQRFPDPAVIRHRQGRLNTLLGHVFLCLNARLMSQIAM